MPLSTNIKTFADAIDELIEWGYAHGGESTQTLLRFCVQRAYHEIIGAADWAIFTGLGRILLRTPITTGTVAYTASTRLLVLSGATWPADAADATVRIYPGTGAWGIGVDCFVESRISDDTLLLAAERNPGVDLAAGTQYSLYRQWYDLPTDFLALRAFMDYSLWNLAVESTVAEIMRLYRVSLSQGYITNYAIGKHPKIPARKAIYVWPSASTTRTADFTYHRRPADLTRSGKDAADMAGTIAGTAGSYAITGTGTAFAQNMAGCVLRAGDATYLPTGLSGLHPYLSQYRIAAVSSATALTLVEPLVEDVPAGTKYNVASLIELESVVLPAFATFAELNLARAKKMDFIRDYVALRDRALLDAMAAAYATRTEIANTANPISSQVPYVVNTGATIL